jgi:hypothetical protein
MFSSLGTFQSFVSRFYAAIATAPTTPSQYYLFSSGNYSGSSPTAIKNQTTNTNDGSYAGASSDLNVSDSPYYGLNLANNLSLSNTTWNSQFSGLSITFRIKVISSRSASCNVIGMTGSNNGQSIGANNFYFTINPSNKNSWIWCRNTSAGLDGGTSVNILSTGWTYVCIVFGRNLTNDAVSANAASYTCDYNNSNGTYSSGNLATMAKHTATVALVDGSTMTGANMFMPYSGGSSDFRIANLKIWGKAMTVAEIQADYAT